MTESAFPFEPVEQAPAFTDEPEGRSRSTLVGLGALGVVLLTAGAVFFLGGGDGAQDAAFTPVQRAPQVQVPAAALEQATTLPTASNVTLGRNPFLALYVEPVAAPVEASPTPVASPAPTAAPIIVINNPPAATTSPAPAAEPVPVRSTVKLTSVDATDPGRPVGSFVLDGKEYQGAKDAVLAGKLLVLDLQQEADGDWFAILQVGDGSPFEVHKNQEVVVQ